MSVGVYVEHVVRGTYESCAVFTEGGLQVRHLLKVVDESWSHLTLQQRVGTEEICYHLILADQSVSERDICEEVF